MGPSAESVVLVDEDDRAVGTAEKLAVHRSGALHRAFSVVLFDRTGRVLLQRRAEGKYHCAGLWSNSCCGHPRPGEPVLDAATRRLAEELGVSLELTPAGQILYRAIMPEGLIEHELDHLFVAQFDGEPAPDRAEVSAWRWVSPAVLRSELDASPSAFTPWLALVLAALPDLPPAEGRKDGKTE